MQVLIIILGYKQEKHLLRMTDGIAHYNGTDIEYLVNYSKPRTYLPSVALFERKRSFF
ncbi:MAG: hypothetical protein IPI19_13695 [Ignavibacteriales bacterium]|nr:hypothetical protein [Ignavibacteriales bacterium]